MSHFVVAVFHKENQSVDELLAPYNENIKNNPNVKWDWYEIGGRWKYKLKLKDGTRANSAKLKNIDFSDFSTYATVTADGQWHEPDAMDWLGISLATPELFLTIVDCHI